MMLIANHIFRSFLSRSQLLEPIANSGHDIIIAVSHKSFDKIPALHTFLIASVTLACAYFSPS